jgi:hypothetical protein
MTPNIDIVGSLKLIAYAPLEYGYKVSSDNLFRPSFASDRDWKFSSDFPFWPLDFPLIFIYF